MLRSPRDLVLCLNGGSTLGGHNHKYHFLQQDEARELCCHLSPVTPCNYQLVSLIAVKIKKNKLIGQLSRTPPLFPDWQRGRRSLGAAEPVFPGAGRGPVASREVCLYRKPPIRSSSGVFLQLLLNAGTQVRAGNARISSPVERRPCSEQMGRPGQARLDKRLSDPLRVRGWYQAARPHTVLWPLIHLKWRQ